MKQSLVHYQILGAESSLPLSQASESIKHKQGKCMCKSAQHDAEMALITEHSQHRTGNGR